MRKKLSSRMLALIMAVVFLAGVVPATVSADGTPADLAVFSFVQGGTATTADLPQSAVSGMFPESSFSHYALTGVSYTASSKSVYANGWDNAGSVDKYWQITTSSAGYSSVSVKFNAWSSGTGPRDFDLLYSTDGANYTVADSYQLTSASKTFSLNLPAGANDAASLTLRFKVSGTVSANGGTVAGTGTSRMAEITISGEGAAAPTKLEAPTASPAPGEYESIPGGVALTGPAGADVLYTTDGSDPAVSGAVFSAPIAVTLPVTVKAISRQAGHLDSDPAEFVYTKKTVTPGGWTLDGDSGNVVSVIYSGEGTVLQTSKGGDYAAASEMSLIMNGAPVSLVFGSGGANKAGGFNGQTGKAYWLLKTSSSAFANLEFSATLRSSGTGPRDFTVQYSADGAEWNNFPGNAVQAGNTVHAPFSVTLPDAAANLGTLYIRVVMASETSAYGGTVGSGGTHQINQIYLKGDYILLDGQVAPVKASVPSGEIPLGAEVTLSSATEGAQTLVSYDGTNYSPASSIVITADRLGAPIYVKATKSGMTDSRVRVLTYTQAKVKAVRPASSVFDVAPGAKVTLVCETPNATIRYAFGDDPQPADFAVYTAPLSLMTLPVSISAFATAPGCIDGDPVKYTYRKGLTVDEYNIYFGQLHSHTDLSDGQGTPAEAFYYAKNTARQIDFLAVTDHSNSFDNTGSYDINGKKTGTSPVSTEWELGHAAADAVTDSSFVGIYGYEMTWSPSTGGFGHMNTYNTVGFESRNDSYFTSNTAAKETNGLFRYYERLTTAPGSLSQLNHPGPTFGDFLDFAFYDAKYDDYVNLIEVGNGEGAVGSGGYFRSYEFYTRALDKGWHVAPSNNQDNHFGKWGDANTGRTVVLAQSLTRDDIYAAIAARRVYATEDDNLGIRYSLDGHPMGYVYPAGTAPTGTVNLHVELTDPDNVIEGSKIAIIVNYGQEAVTRTVSNDPASGAVLTKDASGTTFTWDFTLPATYAYYYVMVTEPGGILSATAPVWLGKVEDMGINKTTTTTVMPVKGEALPVKTTFYNEETGPLTIDRVEYSIDGVIIREENLTGFVVNKGEYIPYEFMFTPTRLGSYNIDVTAYATYGGEPRLYRDVLKLKVADPENLITIAIEAAHYNAYVAGNYAFNYNNFLTLCSANDIRVKVISTVTAESLAGCSAIVMTPPATRAGTYTPRDGSPAIQYTAQTYSQSELDVLAAFAAAGGSFLIGGVADYSDIRIDNKPDYPKSTPYHASTQMNAVLAAIGATTRQGDDEVVDFDNKVNEAYRLAFPAALHNSASPYTDGVRTAQTYSFYSGASVTIDPAKAEWIVKGFDTTFAIDADGDTNGVALSASARPADMNDPRITVAPGDLVALAAEKLPGGGTAFVGGTVFFSDFEIPDYDATNSLQNSNMMVVWNMLKTLRTELPVTPIGTARTYEMGKTVTVEGLAMTYSSGENPALAFFDCLYVQDETGGINVFGITNDMKIKPGQRVRVTGVIHQYLGDLELMIDSPDDLVVVDEDVPGAFNRNTYARDLTPDAVMNPANNGWYAKVHGVVTRVEKDATGKIQAFWLKDVKSDGAEARVFIDGYIGYRTGAPSPFTPYIGVGEYLTAYGFVSADPDGQRLRVSDRDDILMYTYCDLVSASPTTIVSGLSAYLNVEIEGYNMSMLNPILMIRNESGYTSEGYPVVNGTNRIYIPAAPAAGEYTLDIGIILVTIEGEFKEFRVIDSIPLTVATYNPAQLWEPVKTVVVGYLAVRFGETISFNEAKKLVTVDGKPVNATIADDGVTLVTDVKAADVDVAKCVVVVKGLKYQRLFPSYSFTFTIK